MKAVIAIAGCKNSGKSSLCKYISFLVARVDGLIANDMFAGAFDNRHLAQVAKDGSKKVYLSQDGSTYNEAKLIHEPNVDFISFADPVKDICVNSLGLSDDQVYGADQEKNTFTKYLWENMPDHIKHGYGGEKSGNLTAREVMQIVGTVIFRNYFSKNVWVDCLMSRVHHSSADVVLVDDLRFDSEAEALMAHGAMVIHLQRMWGRGGLHKSENGLNLDLFKGYPHFCSVPDIDIMAKNDMAFRSIKEYFKHVIRTQSDIREQVPA